MAFVGALQGIEARDLYNAVLADIQYRAKCALEDEEKMIADIISRLHINASDDAGNAEKELRKSKSRMTELDRIFANLYEDKVNGDISERNYKQLSAKYETEQIALESHIEELEKAITLRKAATEDVDTFVNLIKEYSLITKLDTATLHRLIDKIEVYSAEIIDGEKSQKIEIYYKFVGRI